MTKFQHFSPSAIDALTSGKRPDPLVPGLSIVVGGTGRKVWQFRRRVAKSTVTVNLKLGPFPAYTIPAARKWAEGLNEAVERGEDPRVAIRRSKACSTLTVDKAHAIYMKAMRRGDRKKLKPRTISDKLSIYTRDIEPRLGHKSLINLTENECWDAVYDKAQASKDRANKMAGELSTFLRWCSGREGRMAGIELSQHPAPTLNSNWFSIGPRSNQRFLNDYELGWLLRALCEENLVYRRGFILLLLTAARRNELFGARTSEFVDGIWTLPAQRSKNGEPNVIALGPWGRRLADGGGKWLFPSSRVDGPQLFGWFSARNRIHGRMESYAKSKIESWHFHDLRRTFRSNASRLGIDNDIAELMLNHKRKGMRAVYDKSQELELRAAGFAAWESFLIQIAMNCGAANDLDI